MLRPQSQWWWLSFHDPLAHAKEAIAHVDLRKTKWRSARSGLNMVIHSVPVKFKLKSSRERVGGCCTCSRIAAVVERSPRGLLDPVADSSPVVSVNDDLNNRLVRCHNVVETTATRKTRALGSWMKNRARPWISWITTGPDPGA